MHLKKDPWGGVGGGGISASAVTEGAVVFASSSCF